MVEERISWCGLSHFFLGKNLMILMSTVTKLELPNLISFFFPHFYLSVPRIASRYCMRWPYITSTSHKSVIREQDKLSKCGMGRS